MEGEGVGANILGEEESDRPDFCGKSTTITAPLPLHPSMEPLQPLLPSSAATQQPTDVA